MVNNKRSIYGHSFHLVDPSPWPVMTSLSLFSVALGIVMYFHYFINGEYHLIFGILSFCFNLYRWFSDIVTEATFEGFHTDAVRLSIILGMHLFIASEIMFFFSFFWAFFHFSLTPSISIGGVWPPMGIYVLDSKGLPLLNTVILLSSGVTVTWAHKAISAGNRAAVTKALICTIFYGLFFTFFQAVEYLGAPFSMNDGVYGSIFYMTTGFHGLHVIVGTIMLIVCLGRHLNYHFFKKRHLGLLCAIWYWHFVDIVWIFLYVCVYVWGS